MAHSLDEANSLRRLIAELPRDSSKNLSKDAVRAVIDHAELNFNWCWNVLSDIKFANFEADTGERLVNFQRRLLEALKPLEGSYLQIKQEQRRLVSRKEKYNANWFRRRMALLSLRGKIILDAIAVGRSLGDGFAWLFYEQDQELIRQHLERQPQRLLPTGIGGLGERVVAVGLQGLDGRLLIYHGLTSFLRIGDVSLINLKTCRVDAIGEIKTQQVAPGHYNLTISFLADSREKLPRPDARIPQSPEPAKPLPIKLRQKLDRQTRNLSVALDNAKKRLTDHQMSLEGQFYFDALTQVVERSHTKHFEFIKAGPGLIIGALRNGGKCQLSSGLLNQLTRPERLLHGVQNHALDIVLREQQGNAIIIGSLGFGRENLTLNDRGLPFSWWGAPDAVLRAILFGQVMIVTLYNPAHLIDALRGQGFLPFFDAKGNFEKSTRTGESTVTELRNLGRFHRLICQYLLSQDCVLNMIQEGIEAATSLQRDDPIKMNIDPVILRYDPL